MSRSHSLIVALSLALGTLAAACGGHAVPASPTFEADVKPLLLSRCVRCHGGGGTLNDDPDHGGTFGVTRMGPASPPIDGFFNRLEDDCGDAGSASGCHGLCYYATTKLAIFQAYIHATADDARMPPPPTPALSSRQIEIFDNWLKVATLPGGDCAAP